VATLLDQSGATPLPDAQRALPDSARDLPRFDSLASYEREVWHAASD
jgi:hypothetical protein